MISESGGTFGVAAFFVEKFEFGRRELENISNFF